MKTAIILFRNTSEKISSQYIESVTDVFTDGGFALETVEILSLHDDVSFKRSIEKFNDTVDNLVIIDGGETTFDLKEIIAEHTGSTFLENENAARFLDAVSKADGVEYPKSFAVIPMDATLIPNIHGAYQGFMLDDEDFTMVVLPADQKQFGVMCRKYVLPYLENKFGITTEKQILKYFGSKSKLTSALKKAENFADGRLRMFVKENFGDYTISLSYDGKGDRLLHEIIRNLYLDLKDGIYAEDDVTLSQTVFNLLQLKQIKLSVAESFTAGRVVADIINNPGASQWVQEGIVSYSNESKVSRLNVSPKDLSVHGAVSSVVAYQMTAGLLKTGKCDMAISTTGIAGPKSDDTEKPVGLCYVGIGTKEGVHTYKLNLSGNREQITETAKNTALFLAVKKLKNL